VQGNAVADMEKTLRDDLYAHLQRLDPAFHDEWQSGQLLSRATTDLGSIRRFAGFGMVFLFISVMTLTAVTCGAGSCRRAGQRQLLSFCRAFIAAPSVLVLDEATALLDIPSERLVQSALRTVLAGRTALIIAHRLSTVAIADRVLVLRAGRPIEDGSPAELTGGTGEYADLHARWAASLA
jgi:ABC-type multidrug transport system fused ATPase/permease subunit